MALLIARMLNATPSGSYDNIYTAKLDKHFTDEALLDLLLGAVWGDVRKVDALGEEVKLFLHQSLRALVEWKWNGATWVSNVLCCA